MHIPEPVTTILDRLHASGYEAYVVGGAVRDFCLHRTVTDWDVATAAPPAKIKLLFSDFRLFSLKHDTVTLVDFGRHYEVTTFRGSKDFGRTLEGDLSRRDFTINAMAYDKDKRIILDPYGGRKDIRGKTVRAVRDPADRFEEDPLRLLRAVRLVTELEFRIEFRTLETVSMMADRLALVARERIREELMEILMTRKPSVGFNLMVRTGLLRESIPELLEGYRKRQNADQRYTVYKHVMETIDRVEADPVLRLTALFHDIGKPRVRQKIGGEYRFPGHEEASAQLCRKIMGRLRFSTEMVDRVTTLVAHHMIQYHSGWSDGALRRLIRHVGPENMDLLLRFRKADLAAQGRTGKKERLLMELEKRIRAIRKRALPIQRHDLALDGHRVKEIMGLSSGPEVGRILAMLMEKVIEDPESNTEEKLTGLLKEMKGEPK